MGSKVEFQDFSVRVKAEINETTIGWLLSTGNEIASQASRNTSKSGWTDGERTRLRESYACKPGSTDGVVHVGTPLEQGYWEEWGTGEYAAHGDGRKGWWVYIKGQASQGGGKSYATKEEAEEAAAFLRKAKHLDAVVTNGRKPSYTLEKSFKSVKNPAIAQLERMLKEKMGK